MMRGTKMTEQQKHERAQRRRHALESAERVRAHHAETQRVVLSGACPDCGGPLRRNLSISGWWQCAQLGAITHRADPTTPPCGWQGFTC